MSQACRSISARSIWGGSFRSDDGNRRHYGDTGKSGFAVRRGKRRGLRWGITKKEREQLKELLKQLDLGLEERMTSKVGLLSGGSGRRSLCSWRRFRNRIFSC